MFKDIKRDKYNFKIEGMNSEMLNSYVKENTDNKHLIAFRRCNQTNFLTSFFSEPLLHDGKYIKGTYFSDLVNIYYLDFKIKSFIARSALDIERMLNVTMLNLDMKHRDETNTFGKIYNVFLDQNELVQKTIINEYSKTVNKEYTETEFKDYMESAVSLRNFTLHHYPVLSYKYACIIKNGKAHVTKNGKDRVFKNDFDKLFKLLKNNQQKTLISKIKKHVTTRGYSSSKIITRVINFYIKQTDFENKLANWIEDKTYIKGAEYFIRSNKPK